MQKLFLQQQIPALDRLTIERQNITSLQLMERAAKTVADYIMSHFDRCRIAVMAGPGNNGGDGLVVARMLAIVGFEVTVFSYTGRSGKRSDDCEANFQRLPASVTSHLNVIDPDLHDYDIIVDALLGTGLSRKVEGILSDVICRINDSHSLVISIDIPSGMGSEDSFSALNDSSVIRASHTIGFQQPKISFLMPETAKYIGEWMVTNINIDPSAINDTHSDMFLVEKSDIQGLLKPRGRFVHKGSVGRSLIYAGSKGMMGAAQLCAKACLRSGTGLLTMAIPAVGYDIMQICVPEAMTLTIGDNHLVYDASAQLPRTDAIGIGPGLARNASTTPLVSDIAHLSTPKVIDADALWHLAPTLRNDKIILDNTILTPHEGEFDNITHPHQSRYDRLLTARQLAADSHAVIVLKGAFTAICLPDGRIYFNPTGNPGMATGGSGDVLTGILTALLAQGYSTADAAIIGVYIHGLSGDFAKQHGSHFSLIASDIIQFLGNAWASLS